MFILEDLRKIIELVYANYRKHKEDNQSLIFLEEQS